MLYTINYQWIQISDDELKKAYLLALHYTLELMWRPRRAPVRRQLSSERDELWNFPAPTALFLSQFTAKSNLLPFWDRRDLKTVAISQGGTPRPHDSMITLS